MARERAAAVAGYNGIRLVEDSLDIDTCEGAATIGLELADTVPSFDAVLIALGGGTLATGVGHVLYDLLLVADDAVLVQEASIIAGMRVLLDHAGLVVEPSAALGIAAILEDRDRFAGRHVSHHRTRQQRRHGRLSPLGRCGSHLADTGEAADVGEAQPAGAGRHMLHNRQDVY